MSQSPPDESPAVEIDLTGLRANFALIRRKATGAKILVVLKANAYGHGAVRVAKALKLADGFGIARLSEAIRLRQAGVQGPILVLHGFSSVEELPLFVRYRLMPVLHAPWQCEAVAHLAPALPALWLKIDTGMNRLGLRPEVFQDHYRRLVQKVGEERLVLMTHLACADQVGHPMTERQLEQFRKLTADLPSPKSFANSAAILQDLHHGSDWLRPGLMLYGVSPFPDREGGQLGLRPVMTLKSRIIALKRIARGEAVGYGAAWRAPRETRLGVVSIGYGDGYPREVARGTQLLVSGRRATIVGRVAMDLLTVDLTDLPGVGIGEEVVLWGEGLPVEEVARRAGTIPYTLLCNIADRVHYRYRPAEGDREGSRG